MQRKLKKSDDTSNDSGLALSCDGSDNSSVERYETTPKTRRSVASFSKTTPVKPKQKQSQQQKQRKRKPRKQYICEICEKHFLGSSDLRKHSRVHTDERPFACDKCSKRFRQAVSLKNHIASIHGTDQRFSCEHCKKSFPLKERLKLHLRIHSGEKPYNCTHCSKTFARGGQLRQHLVTHDSNKKYKCLECPSSFTSLSSLRLHTKIHANDFLKKKLIIIPTAKGKDFHCKICNKSLKGHLHQHMKIHENIRSHSCNICGLQFSQKSHLNVHQRMHSGERPYRCRVCWQAFGHSSVLKLHIRKHTGEKPFKCLMCTEKGVAFSQLPHLKNHMKVIHGKDKPYMCESCQEFFKTKNDLQLHSEECPKAECDSTASNVEGNQSGGGEDSDDATLSKLRLLVAILLKRISTEDRLKQLGFEKRLIDNVIVSALKMARRKCFDDEELSEVCRFRLNIKEFLEWTIPATFMNKFKQEHKSIEELLEELATAYSKVTAKVGNDKV